jgi:hypothetical protein
MLMFLKCSAAGAIANGLCYYAFYAHHPITNTVIAAAVADVSWCVSIPYLLQNILSSQELYRSKKAASHSTAT